MILRTDEQTGVFGELNFELVPDLWSLSLGTRYYDIEVDLTGSARGGFGSKDNNGDGVTPAPVLNPAANNLTTLFGESGAGPDKATADGWIPKVSLSYTPSENAFLRYLLRRLPPWHLKPTWRESGRKLYCAVCCGNR